jgi:hypothetical protein
MQSKNLNNAYLQCIAKIGCNITINSGCNYVKSKAKSFNIPAMPAAGPIASAPGRKSSISFKEAAFCFHVQMDLLRDAAFQ